MSMSILPTKVFDRTISKVVTPRTRFGEKTLCFFKISQAIGTVELTGFEMIQTSASGHVWAIAVVKSATMVAFTLKRSSRVMPGLRGTPAGITTTSQPSSAFFSSAGPTCALTLHLVSMWLKSAPTPFVCWTSYSDKWSKSGDCLRRSDSGWPMPPPAPNTATFRLPLLWLLYFG